MTPNDRFSTDASLSATGRLVPVPCPECGGTLARRSHRNGLTEKIFSLAYVYPFRCQLCGHRFHALQWGARYHRIPVERPEADHREYHRHLFPVPVMLFNRHGEFHGKTIDVSTGGCSLLTPGPVRKQSRWSVRLLMPFGPRPVTVDDAVVHAVRNQQIGMEFLRFAPSDKERFGRFINTTWKQTAPRFDKRLSRPGRDSRIAGTPVQPGQSPSLQ